MEPIKTIIRSGYAVAKTTIHSSFTILVTVIRGVIGQLGLVGFIIGASTCTGTLRAKGNFAGISDGSSTATGTIRISSSYMAGTSEGIATVSGTLTAKGVLIVTVASIGTANGTMLAKGALVGSGSGLSTVTGSLGMVGTYTGTSAGSSTATGILTGKGQLAALSNGIATIIGALVAKGTLAGISDGLSTISAGLAAKGILTGTSAGIGSVSVATLAAKGILAGTIAGISTASSTLAAKGTAAGSSAGASTAAGTIRIAGGAITGTSTGTSTAAATLIGWDTDFLAYNTLVISMGGSLTATEKTSTSDLIKSFKAHGLWTKILVIHGVGSSAITQLANLKDPRDLDAAFRGVKTGTITHSSTGYDPNGSTGYIDTKFSPLSHGSQNSMGFFYYSRQNNTGSVQMSMGCYDGASASTNINHSTTANSGRVAINQNDSDALFVIGVTDTRGFWHAVRSSSTTLKLYINGAVNASDTVNTSNTPISQNVFEGARNSGSGGQLFCNQACGISGITLAMNDTEASDFYNDWLTWLTANSRQN